MVLDKPCHPDQRRQLIELVLNPACRMLASRPRRFCRLEHPMLNLTTSVSSLDDTLHARGLRTQMRMLL